MKTDQRIDQMFLKAVEEGKAHLVVAAALEIAKAVSCPVAKERAEHCAASAGVHVQALRGLRRKFLPEKDHSYLVYRCSLAAVYFASDEKEVNWQIACKHLAPHEITQPQRSNSNGRKTHGSRRKILVSPAR